MVIEIILGIIILVQLAISYLERKDFNDRLMAKNFTEYKDNQVKDEPNKLPEEDEGIPVEDARELIDES